MEKKKAAYRLAREANRRAPKNQLSARKRIGASVQAFPNVQQDQNKTCQGELLAYLGQPIFRRKEEMRVHLKRNHDVKRNSARLPLFQETLEEEFT